MAASPGGAFRKTACLALLALCACASAPITPDSPPAAVKPALFVEDPIELLPDMMAVAHVNMRRLRADRELFDGLIEAMASGADMQPNVERMRGVAERLDSVIVGARASTPNGPPHLVMVVRSGRGPLLSPEDQQALLPNLMPGDYGMLWRQSEDVVGVMVDTQTLMIFESALRTSMQAVLAKGPTRRFKEEPAYQALAGEVAFGAAPLTLLGSLSPQMLARLTEPASEGDMGLRALMWALQNVRTYGGQIDLAQDVSMRLVAQGPSASQMGVLAGAILMMKTAVSDARDKPALSRLAQGLQVQARGQILELSYRMSRQDLLNHLQRWLSGRRDAPQRPAPKGSEI